ncbi:MAG: hypothetical protein GY725_01265 [bacterium]|nr:hypothetical protein [bacterium]
MGCKPFSRLAAWILAVSLIVALPSSVGAKMYRMFVTGEDGATDVIFSVTFDPQVPGSAVVFPILGTSIRVDGIDFVPGTTSEVVVGAQLEPGPGGEITHYDPIAGTTLASYVPSTGGSSKPSTILSTLSHAYYILNQFGFAGTTHRIIRTPFAGPAGTTEIVFDGSDPNAGSLVNLEGLELVGSTLYFFALDNAAAPGRALYSIGLSGGLWDGAPPAKLLSPLAGAPVGDGSDELDLDENTGIIYGSNVVNAEVIYWDTGLSSGGFLIGPGVSILGPNTTKLAASPIDGIRATGDGWLVLTGLNGTIFSIDIAGVLAGFDDGDVLVIEDNAAVSFDDMTPLSLPVPLTSPWSSLPLCLLLFMTAAVGVRGMRSTI